MSQEGEQREGSLRERECCSVCLSTADKSGYQGKGSRFQHAEKLQFADVSHQSSIIHPCLLHISNVYSLSQEEEAPMQVEEATEEVHVYTYG